MHYSASFQLPSLTVSYKVRAHFTNVLQVLIRSACHRRLRPDSGLRLCHRRSFCILHFPRTLGGLILEAIPLCHLPCRCRLRVSESSSHLITADHFSMHYLGLGGTSYMTKPNVDIDDLTKGDQGTKLIIST
jgi:hypothetical protein